MAHFALTKLASKDYIQALPVMMLFFDDLPADYSDKKITIAGLKRMKFFLCVVGMVMIIEGLPYFAFPEKMKFWIQKIAETPDGSLRRFGLVLMGLGLVLVYWGRI